MNSCCTLYHIDPQTLGEPVDIKIEECSGCKCDCGYIQFENLIPYLTKLTNNYTDNQEHINLEAKLRQQVIEISRLFDAQTRVEPGTYSKAHYKIIKLYGDGSRYLKIPEFVKNSLELYTDNGYLINSNSYAYIDGNLVIRPCEHLNSSCGCTNVCGMYQADRLPIGWKGCFQAKAKFGKECSDFAVQLAIKDYILEHNTFGDAKEANFQGFPVSRGFRVPYSWSSLVNTYLQNKLSSLENSFGFA